MYYKCAIEFAAECCGDLIIHRKPNNTERTIELFQHFQIVAQFS